MAQFYGEIQGNRGEATRMGTKDSGFRGHIRGWRVGGSINCYYNGDKDRDEISIYATKGSGGYGSSEHVATVIEIDDDDNQIRLNPSLTKLLSAIDFVQMKENISALIFDYDNDDYIRPHEEDCNAIADLILEKLNYKPINRGY